MRLATPSSLTPRLLRHALLADALATRAIAGAVESAWQRGESGGYGLRGLSTTDWHAVLMQHFPTAVAAALPAFVPVATDAEFDELQTLLLEAAAQQDRQTRWLASAVASAAMFDDHLWQDLQLDDRAMLSALLHQHFGPLARRNTGNMRWKAFFYKQLCERAGQVCRAPSCSACSDYAECFGSEDSADPAIALPTAV